MATQTSIRRVESFPFDSKADGYDADGYPVYDRAVGASMLRSTFAKFFTDGVFPSPADGLQVSKGDGLSVNIKPGICIIKGAMGGIIDTSDPVSLQLDNSGPQGNVVYGIMLHYDENDTAGTGRSISLRVVRGEPATDPQPPAPDQSTPGIWEYRLGSVKVLSGSTDMSSAVITNEKGTGVCPFAAPFEEIDMEAVIIDARQNAQEVLANFEIDIADYAEEARGYIQKYYDLVASALDGTTAGNLQQQIDELEQSIGNTDLTNQIDDKTIGYGSVPGQAGYRLHVLDGSIGEQQLALPINGAGGIASTGYAFGIANDLAKLAYEFHAAQLDTIDFDNMVTWTFPDDVQSYEGNYSSGQYYADQGSGA